MKRKLETKRKRKKKKRRRNDKNFSNKDNKDTEFQELLGQLRRFWPDYTVSPLEMVIGSLGEKEGTARACVEASSSCEKIKKTLGLLHVKVNDCKICKDDLCNGQ
nr:unnamed protein product [Callosobruchus chinensis]